jgi:hypothetical protein
MAFLDSMMAIANGVIGAAASKVESTLAGLLVLAISFLAGFLGLNKIADKVMDIINTKVRAPVDKAIDFVINWIVTTAKSLFKALFGKKDAKPDERTDAQKQADLRTAMSAAQSLLKQPGISPKQVKKGLKSIKEQYRLTTLDLVTDRSVEKKETDHLHGEINPVMDGDPVDFTVGMPTVTVDFDAKSYNKTEYSRQLRMQQSALRAMKIFQWIAGRTAFLARKTATGSGRDPQSKALQEAFRAQERNKRISAKIAELMASGDSLEAAQPKAEDWWNKQAALHPLDQVAGGGAQPTDMGDSAINSSIGASWNSSQRLGKIKETVDKITDPQNRQEWNMDVAITMNGTAV